MYPVFFLDRHSFSQNKLSSRNIVIVIVIVIVWVGGLTWYHVKKGRSV